MVSKKVSKEASKEYYILKDMENDDRFGERYIFSDKKPRWDTGESRLRIAGTVQVSGDIDIFDQVIIKE